MEFMMVGAELATALLPLITVLGQIIQDFILPVLTKLAEWFSGMRIFKKKIKKLLFVQ